LFFYSKIVFDLLIGVSYRFTNSVTLLPVGKIPIVWQLFLSELSEKYIPVLTEAVLGQSENVDKKQQQRKTKQSPKTDHTNRSEGGLFRAFSQVVHLFVSFLGGLVILNENAPNLLGLTFKTCTEALEILLPLSLGLNPALLMTDSDVISLLQRRRNEGCNTR